MSLAFAALAQIPNIANEHVYNLVANTIAGAAIVFFATAIGFLQFFYKMKPPNTEFEERAFNKKINLAWGILASSIFLGVVGMVFKLPPGSAKNVTIAVKPEEAMSNHGVKLSRGKDDLAFGQNGRASFEIKEKDQLDVELYFLMNELKEKKNTNTELHTQIAIQKREAPLDDPK